jgi:HSP20 family protein
MVAQLVPWRTRLPRTFERLEDEMENLMGRFFTPLALEEEWGLPEAFSPRTNVVETENEFEITVELPGMKADEFDIELKRDQLWISGERKQEEEEKGKTYHRIEHRYGAFRRVIPLPTEVKEEKVDAQYRDGILRIVVPKAETVKPKHIEVKT